MLKFFNIRSPLIAFLLYAVAATLHAEVVGIGISVSVHTAPPPLPVYVQPPCPSPGYLWTPGYWAWGQAGYYWVPGVWVMPPHPNLLWTPGYWGFAGGVYAWRPGYWAPHVGFYGGVNYGFGYTGVGFVGGAWSGGVFRYNVAVMNVNPAVVHNVYIDRTVVRSTSVVNRISFSGPGGIVVRPTPLELAAARERHFEATPMQISHQQVASQDRAQFASFNHGRPGVTAMDSVNGRRYSQQGRIAQGVRTGQLTSSETGRLEQREQSIHSSVAADRTANGGRLSPRERQNIDRRQNRVSRQIYRDKHNGATAPR